MAVGVKLEQLRFLRETARKLQNIADNSPLDIRAKLLKLVTEIEREASDLDVIAWRDNR
jgi:hypothetical protein